LLYKTKELDRDRPESIEADFEEVAASCGHFSFSLQAFANEMQTYLTILEELKDATEKPTRSWNWLRFWKKTKPNQRTAALVSPEEEALIQQSRESEVPKNATDAVLQRHETQLFRGTLSHTASKKHPLNDVILRVVRFFGRDDG
jgi:hypothetical protein